MMYEISRQFINTQNYFAQGERMFLVENKKNISINVMGRGLEKNSLILSECFFCTFIVNQSVKSASKYIGNS